jgi:thiol-disulfide isomerase/thioredoxin
MKYPWLLFLTLAAGMAQAGDAVESALARARKAHTPVLLEFRAPWCYSCYYMARNVLTGAQWQQAQREMVIVDIDADSPEGSRIQQQWQVKMLPSYVVLNERGQELGRILGEQPRVEFYGKLSEINRRGNSLDVVAAQMRDGSPASVKAGREMLAAYLARYDAAGGLAWQAQLPEAARAALFADPAAALLSKRLVLLSASQSRDVNACLAAGQAVLAGDLGCERYYELDRYMSCAAERPVTEQRALLKPQRPALEQLLSSRVFGSGPACADERSAVFAAADLYQKTGDNKAEQAVLARAIAQTEKRLAGDLKKDRNQADNLRVYLDRAGRTRELDALLVKLIAAYPEDYVYPYRHGKNLLARGQAAQALPFLEKAAGMAYGQNRLKVAEQRAQALLALRRRDDARKVISEALVANGPWFPEDAAKLKAVLTKS